MQKILHRTGTIVLIIVFLYALIPDIMVQHLEAKNTDLRETISSLQHLAQQTDSRQSDFASAYKNSALLLKQVAGIKTLVFNSQQESDTDSQTILFIIISLFYIISSTLCYCRSLSSQRISILERQISYTSVIYPPTIPPPEALCFSRCY